MEENLKMSRKTINKSIAILVDLHVIEVFKDLNDRRVHAYRLNPLISWKGKECNRKKAIKGLQKDNYVIDFK